eukprot:CAMPEP_0184326858 /NCGR_PEP_ID=MMETSP1049-20130417/142784_1 /TAXON_ID=77928 /ORGANISM="Proteomonas sulcata, Strain CCMP704" /LENGTH=97 /DNA_ID=CAMNT_0026649083 /DNA_START=3638 /DNA_END=3927 /DNA_ORIENTATION=+
MSHSRSRKQQWWLPAVRAPKRVPAVSSATAAKSRIESQALKLGFILIVAGVGAELELTLLRRSGQGEMRRSPLSSSAPQLLSTSAPQLLSSSAPQLL